VLQVHVGIEQINNSGIHQTTLTCVRFIITLDWPYYV